MLYVYNINPPIYRKGLHEGSDTCHMVLWQQAQISLTHGLFLPWWTKGWMEDINFLNRIICVWKRYAIYTGSLQSVSFLFCCTRKGPRVFSEYSESFTTSQTFNHEKELTNASAELWLSLCFSKGILYLLCLSCIITPPFQTHYYPVWNTPITHLKGLQQLFIMQD